ncbi:type II toxin-antitoxin system RelE/ParE family toxin [Sphingorhabdus sp.]|uniref:type II toxin-antitoxin system RelE/ParE family toxin n=1 Tax=Sphingorhabdus sp. TaxID=1902408 RepID=UPI00405420B9
MKPVTLRKLAEADVDAALAYYLSEAGADTALAFVEQLEQANQRISNDPAIYSPRWGAELNLPGLRSLRLSKFPYVIFYIEQADHIDVWRVLHAQRDIPAYLQDDD